VSAWIEMIPDAEATGPVKQMYDKVRTPHGTVDNVMRAHSLRPHTMDGHVVLYKSVLHHPANALSLAFLECIGSYTSWCNKCDYSYTHHSRNTRRLLEEADPAGGKARADAVIAAIEADRPEDAFEGKDLALMRYARKLTLEPGAMVRADWDALKAAGAEDGEILEVNQVCAYFNYSNRLLNGLGVTTEGDIIGYYK